ncbi:MAG: EamA family transporter RarD [Planctomycetes bacterium]|nr:EamA family transporter RarD [Planctomycetota bacterium]
MLYGIAAYLWWGLVAVYFKAVADVPAPEILAHRMLWSLVLVGGLIGARGRWADVRAAVAAPRTFLTLAATTLLIATNWFLFIWTVTTGQMLQASLGYFINPLVNVLLGALFLHERLRPRQWASVALAAGAVLYLTISLRTLPTVALVLAVTFAFYGMLRKTVRADALVGLTVETGLLAPFALAYLIYLKCSGELAFAGPSWRINLLLPAAGIVTAVPLLLFAHAVRRLRLSTVGFLQYISPSLQFLLAVVAFGESFTATQRVAVGLIWTALALYTMDGLAAGRGAARASGSGAAAAPAAAGGAPIPSGGETRVYGATTATAAAGPPAPRG